MCIEDHSHVCIYHQRFSDAQRKSFVTQRVDKIGTQVKIIRPYMTDEEVTIELERHGEVGYSKLPEWLRKELEARNLPVQVRQPTELEQWETVADAREHRILNKELGIEDYKDKYIKGKSFAIL